MNQTSHLITSVSSRAKKEIRSKGGIHSHEKIYLNSSNPASSFALRIFVSELFAGRRDIEFVRKETNATLILSDKTLDDIAEDMLTSVLDGTAVSYLTVPKIRNIHPFSGIPGDEIAAYAKHFGWIKETSESSDASSQGTPKSSEFSASSKRVHEFLNVFSVERPSAKYALKNVADKFHEKADILSLQIHNHERRERQI